MKHFSDDNELTQEIYQIHMDLPDVDLLLLKNTNISKNEILIGDSLRGNLRLPSMYESWTENRRQHVSFNWVSQPKILKKCPEKDLLIFDTWGTSSYYHLLLDHIVPVWITREWLKKTFGAMSGEVDYLRISKNEYPTELETSQDIFRHFLGQNFVETITGDYRYLAYGYFFNYRPYLGPKYPRLVSLKYREYLQQFRIKFCKYSKPSESAPILVPVRNSRNFEFVDRFVQKYSHRQNFHLVDFGKLPITEQIRLSGSAAGIFGCEGAAFANAIFMREHSFVMPVATESHRFLFHDSLSSYIPHRFKPVLINSLGLPSLQDDDLLRFMEQRYS